MRFFHTFLGSFYSAPTYQQARQEDGWGLGYSFLVVVLTTLFVIISYTAILHQAVFASRHGKAPLFDDIVMQIVDQLPIMTLQQSKLQTQDAQKHTILLHAELFGHTYQGAFATIDTSGQTTYETMQTPMLVTANEMIMRSSRETKIKSFKELFGKNQGTLVINHAVATDMGHRLIQVVHDHLIQGYLIIGIFGWIGFIMVLYILRLFMLLILGVGGLIIGNCLNTPASYGTCVRLAGIAYTPVTVISMVFLGFGNPDVTALCLLLCGLIMLTAAFVVTRETSLAPRA